MKKLALFLFLAVVAHAQSACPSNAWCSVWAPTSGVLTPINGAWNSLIYSPDSNRVYVDASTVNYPSPWENAWASYINPNNCGGGSNQPCSGLSVNPWVIISDTGDRTGTALSGTYTTNATLGGVTACDGNSGSPVPSNATTIAINLPGNSKTLYSHGAWAVENEVIEFDSIISGNGTACIVYGTLTRGSRNTTAASHTATAAPGSAAQYTPPASFTAAQFLANTGISGGMQTDVGSGLATTTDVPTERHPSRDYVYDTIAKRIFQAGGYYETRPFADMWSLCITGAGSTTSDCPTGNSSTPGSIAYGWTRIAAANQYTGHQESMGVWDSDHGAFYLYGGQGPTSDMWVYCPHITGSSPAICNSIAGTWQHVTPTCTGPCPQRQAGQMRYDPDDHLVLMFGGGATPTAANTNMLVYAPTATNSLSLAANTWTTKSSPSGVTTSNCCRWPSFAYDTSRHIGIFYYNTGTLYTYTVSTDTWTLTTVPGGPSTNPSTNGFQNNLVYNSHDDLFVYMGNGNGTGNNVLTTWELPGSAISNPPAGPVFPRTTRGVMVRR